MTYAIERLLRALENVVANRTKERDEAHTEFGAYVYVPYREEDFLEILKVGESHAPLHKASRRKFIDVGCGIGSKVFLAQQVLSHFDTYGIEYDPDYVAVARKLLREGRAPTKIIQGDAREHDYSPYDIIYFYVPMQDPERQRQLQDRIIRTAKRGAIIIAVGGTMKETKALKFVWELSAYSSAQLFRRT